MVDKKAISFIAGAVLINLTLGTFYSVGNLVPYIASYMRANGSPEVTVEYGPYITAAFLLGQGAFIIVGSVIERQYDSRIACIFGCLIHCLSTFLTWWAMRTSLLALVLIYGLGSGMGTGSAYMASIVAAQKWFPQAKGIVTGIIVGGFGLGGLIFTWLQTKYMNPNNVSPDCDGFFPETVFIRTPHLFLYMGAIFTVVQTIGCIIAFPPPASLQTNSNQTQVKSPGGNSNQPSNTIVREEMLPSQDNLKSAFNYKIFYVIGLMMMLVAPGVTMVNSLGKKYGQTFIQDDKFLATVVAVSAVANALGRLTWGFMINRYDFSTCFLAKVVLFASLIALFPFWFILSSYTLYTIWMLGLFFGFSGTFVLFPVYIEQVFGVKYHGIIYGILYIFLALSSIITSFTIQTFMPSKLSDTSQTLVDNPCRSSSNSSAGSSLSRYLLCFIIAAMYIASIALYYLSMPISRLEHAIRKRNEAEFASKNNSLFNREDLFPIDRGNLAEKFAMTNKSTIGMNKTNSLGSIVRFTESPADQAKIKTLGKA